MSEYNEYWEKKVVEVTAISKEYGFDFYDCEFWSDQPAGVISLIIDIHNKKQTNLKKDIK